ncbi:MAG: N-6 DNA methylase [Deltaproteobacteria bacterium]|nr:N-6 DNA methylase [Deltaproteobacteria bacterium]
MPQKKIDVNKKFLSTFLTVSQAANHLNVADSTIKNWIKTKELNVNRDGRIDSKEFEKFCKRVAGSKKLTGRANKSLKDFHDHEGVKREIESFLDSKAVDINEAGYIYENMLSNSYRNREGIYYTPEDIVKRFFKNLPDDCSNMTFCDPCCGSGNFIMAALLHGFKPENIFGFDIDPLAVKITKQRLYTKLETDFNNVAVLDFLEENNIKNKSVYDVIFTNPPWGKKLDNSQKIEMAKYGDNKLSKDSTALFFLKSLQLLKPGGVIGFLVQDAFFNVNSFYEIRQKALSLKILELIDFGKPFKGLLTRARGLIIKNSSVKSDYLINCEIDKKNYLRTRSSFEKNPKSILNISKTEQEALLIEHLFSIKHITLKGRVRFGMGIVTGNNREKCRKRFKKGLLPVFRGKDIFKTSLNRSTCFIEDNFSVLQQVAPLELYMAKEKLIYRFISSDLVFYYDDEQKIFLNSANMIVPDEDFPISVKALCQLLNSEIINWLFKSLFETHKVLRTDLESLPVHVEYFEIHSEFSDDTYLEYLKIKKTGEGLFEIDKG